MVGMLKTRNKNDASNEKDERMETLMISGRSVYPGARSGDSESECVFFSVEDVVGILDVVSPQMRTIKPRDRNKWNPPDLLISLRPGNQSIFPILLRGHVARINKNNASNEKGYEWHLRTAS